MTREIAERHVKRDQPATLSADAYSYCLWCLKYWPCDAAVLLERVKQVWVDAADDADRSVDMDQHLNPTEATYIGGWNAACQEIAKKLRAQAREVER